MVNLIKFAKYNDFPHFCLKYRFRGPEAQMLLQLKVSQVFWEAVWVKTRKTPPEPLFNEKWVNDQLFIKKWF